MGLMNLWHKQFGLYSSICRSVTYYNTITLTNLPFNSVRFNDKYVLLGINFFCNLRKTFYRGSCHVRSRYQCNLPPIPYNVSIPLLIILGIIPKIYILKYNIPHSITRWYPCKCTLHCKFIEPLSFLDAFC